MWSSLKALYFVLFAVFLMEPLTGSHLLEPDSRRIIMAVTVVVVFVGVSTFFTAPGPGRSKRLEPKRDPKSHGHRTAHLDWAVSEVQGWREHMEDATCTVPSLPEPMSQKALFAVFDGHGGDRVSKIVAHEFPRVIAECATDVYSTLEASDDDEVDRTLQADEQVLRMAMQSMDAMLRKAVACTSCGQPSSVLAGTVKQNTAGVLPGTKCIGCGRAASSQARPGDMPFNLVGSTAVVALVDCGKETPLSGRPRRITVANCGDSRAVLCRSGRAWALSEDHKPELEREKERIEKADGKVERPSGQPRGCYRVDGWGLNLSRALGDFHYKANTRLPVEEQKVIAVPEIQSLHLCDEDEFVVLACDGVFELHTSQEVINIVRNELRNGADPRKAAETLVSKSVSPDLQKTFARGSDNCSAIVLCLNR